jgi:hypothetical protein
LFVVVRLLRLLSRCADQGLSTGNDQKPRVTEVPMDTLRVTDGQFELALRIPRRNMDQTEEGRIAILDEKNVLLANGFSGVDLGSARIVEVP